MNDTTTENKIEPEVTSSSSEQKTSLPLLIANLTLVGFVISFGFMIYQTKHASSPHAVVQTKPADMSAFNAMHLDAKSVFVWDINAHKAIFAKDAQTPRALASLTKLMTAVTALSILPPHTVVTIKDEFLNTEGNSGLYANERWNLKDILDYSLIVSSNDGAHSIAAVAGAFASSTQDYNIGLQTFIVKMNQMALHIGLPTMHFSNETGLDVSDTQAGSYGSAEDVAKLMEYAMKKYPNVLEVTKNQATTISSYDKSHMAINTDSAVSKIPNLIASKTGYTALAGGNVAVVFDAGIDKPIAIVVLGSSFNGRFTDMEQLASSTLAYIRENNF
jgi:D-alanyl-D-alanine carboxypeptidase